MPRRSGLRRLGAGDLGRYPGQRSGDQIAAAIGASARRQHPFGGAVSRCDRRWRRDAADPGPPGLAGAIPGHRCAQRRVRGRCPPHAAAAASTALPLVETPLINSPTKEEVKAKNKILKDSAAAYKCKILSLESKNETTKWKAERLHVRVRLLSESLKMEKKKSRMAIEQLLILTTSQHNELMSKFQEKIQDVHTEHDRAMFMLHGARRRDLLNNQKSVECLQKEHGALVTKLESDYRKDLTKMENNHNKSMVCARHICFFYWVTSICTHVSCASMISFAFSSSLLVRLS